MTTTDTPAGPYGWPPAGSAATPAFDTAPPPQNTAPPPYQPPPAQQAAPPPEPDEDALPVFGRRFAPINRVSFELATYDQAGKEALHKLTAVPDIDVGSMFGFTRAGKNTARQLGATQNLLSRVLVDDDGISHRADVEEVVPHPDEDHGNDWVPFAENPGAADDSAWRTPDGKIFDTEDDAQAHMRTNGSSLRRFAAIMDDDGLVVMLEALEDIIDFVMSKAADRPTQRSSAPSRSRRRKGR